eukprot:CAMPEP_0177560446 /NCGR_PEP_ID=MMETSP0369-20130122/71387_1 /TAXON_ID=447022 ORGANISM="Scrippsiella hangoei-like, Strain SHHI-4" /NCGR_SAMPLE_ID=MMETSP0369 /ASSEMBLY_ACC=CAM_ASM_000364 /LENGTH=64 /DNA_ID=CAMNT_0019047269 /DNA_START=647 /DNA_END=841 /DNA_ORIENTATION=+
MKKNMTVADGGVVNCPSQQQQHLREAARILVRRGGRSRRVPVDHLSEPDQSSQAHQRHPVPKGR